MIYVLAPRDLRPLPRPAEEVDFALDVFPALLEGDVPFYVHATDDYWNDVGSLPEYLQGNLDVLTGAVDVEPAAGAELRRRGRRHGRRRGRARAARSCWRRGRRGSAPARGSTARS